MYVYRTELQTITDSTGTTERNIFTVGYYYTHTDVEGYTFSEWYTESEHSSRRDASARCNYLNGGDGAHQG